MPAARNGSREALRCDPEKARLVIERFLNAAAQPILSEPGEEPIALVPGAFALEVRSGRLYLQAWDGRRNLIRHVLEAAETGRGKLGLRIERFGQKAGLIEIVDAGRRPAPSPGRYRLREDFRRWLKREMPGYSPVSVSAEANLEQSLSPSYPRAFLRKGGNGWAALAAPAGNVDGVLSFGLIWLDRLRQREAGVVIQGLLLFVPEGHERNTCLRLRYLNPAAAQFRVFVYGDRGVCRPADLNDHGNLDTRLEPWRAGPPAEDEKLRWAAAISGAEARAYGDGSIGFSVNGLEFARWSAGRLVAGIETKRSVTASNLGEVEALATGLAEFRTAEASPSGNFLRSRDPEKWLEARVRANLEALDARLLPEPVYGQVPAFAGADRGVLDLLALDRTGRLTVIELKASEDIHLPLQALDYWLRVKWHLDRGDFERNGYFPGHRLRQDPPRLLLAAPALAFHPANECVLRYFRPEIEVERIGLAHGWRKEINVMFRM